MEGLVVGVPLLAGESENKIKEASIPDLVPDDLRKVVVPRSCSTEVPSTFEGVGIMLQVRQRLLNQAE